MRRAGGARPPCGDRAWRESTAYSGPVRLLRRSPLALALAGAITVFHVATLRAGHSWGDDFVQSLAPARTLAWGRPYARPGYVSAPRRADVGPRSYPPLYPLLLAPVYAVRGLDFRALKLVGTTAFGLALLT